MLGLLRRVYWWFLERKKRTYLTSLQNKGLKIGENVEIVSDFFFDPSHCFLISIGDDVTFAPNVRLIAHDASTKKLLGFTRVAPIIIESGVFLGDSVLVLPGVTIGKDSIVGTGSVVTQDIPAGSVAVGSPAKVITSIAEYKERIRQMSEQGRVFNESYLIENIDQSRREEMLTYLASDGQAFIP